VILSKYVVDRYLQTVISHYMPLRLGRPSVEDLPDVQTESGHEIPIMDLLHVDPDNLPNGMAEQADWQALIGYQHALAVLRREKLDRKLKELEATVSVRVFEEIEEEDGKRPTIAMIDNRVMTNSAVIGLKDKIEVAKLREKSLEVLRSAFQTRKDMLIQLGAEIRLDRKLTT
jgi:hypothetical protein